MKMSPLKLWVAAASLASLPATAANIDAKFPATLRLTAITDGYAVAGWTVMPDGRIDDAIVLEASHRAFGQSLLDALPRRLSPDRTATLPRFESVQVLFRRRHAINTYHTTQEMLQARGEGAAAPAIKTVRLDRAPGLTLAHESLAPICPDTHAGGELGGTATVHFVIDTTGRVRTPRVLAASSDTFALAALSAVRQWQFEPPILNGSAVQLDEVQTFSVAPTSACLTLVPHSPARVAQHHESDPMTSRHER